MDDKIKTSMDLTVLLTIEQLCKDTKKSEEEVFVSFMESETAKMVYDDSTKLWWNGPSYVADEYLEELKRSS